MIGKPDKLEKLIEVLSRPDSTKEDLEIAFKILMRYYKELSEITSQIYEYAEAIHEDNKIMRSQLKKPSFKDDLYMN